MPMTRVLELEPAQEAHRYSELRTNKAALNAVENWQTALIVCEYNGKPFPVSLPEESYDYIVMLLEQRRAELA
jgi:hypothetical protein